MTPSGKGAGERLGIPSWARTLIAVVAVTAVHYLLQTVSLAFVGGPGKISILWLPEGFLIAVLTVVPVKHWLRFLIPILPTIAYGDVAAGKSVFEGGALALANLFEAVVGAAILLRFRRTWSDENGVSQMMWTILGACAVPSALGGVIGALVMAEPASFLSFIRIWSTWSAATLVGTLMTLPLSLAILRPSGRLLPEGWASKLEFGSLLASTYFVASALLGEPIPLNGDGQFGLFTLFPFLIWGALRFEVLGAGAALGIIGILSAFYTSRGIGRFALISQESERQVLFLQLFMLITSVSTQLLAAAAAQRSHSARLVQEQEQRYRSLVEQASDGIFVTDAEGRCVEVNQAGCELLGYSRSELLEMNLQDVLEPAEQRQAQARIDAIRRGISFLDERRLVRKDGSRVLVEINAKALANGNLLGICRDLSERVRHESVVQALVSGTAGATGQRFFQLAVSNLSSALQAQTAIIAELEPPTGSSLRVLAVSDGVELEGRLVPIEHSTAAKMLEKGRYICAEGAAEQFPDDEILKIAGAEAVVGVALVNAANTAVGLAMVLYDEPLKSTEPNFSILSIFGSRIGAEIERVRGERALRQSESRQRALLEAFPDPLFVLTLDGIYVDYHVQNPDRLRKAPSEFIGKSYRDVMPPEIVGLYDRAFEAMRKGKIPKVFEYESSFSGPSVIYEVRHVSVGDGLVLAILRDITARKAFDAEIERLNASLERQVEERTAQLEAANQELETFAYSVSHDLRAPLRAIASNAQILREDLGERATSEESQSLDRIVERSSEMSSLIDGLLKLSRIMRAELQRVEVDLSSLAEKSIEQIRRAGGANVETEVAPGVKATGDPVLLGALIGNLLENAFKFSAHAKRPRVEFGVADRNGETVYFVRDNGAGFNPEYSDRLFRPFERLHTDEEFPGMGIGLATSARIVHRHQGRIWAEGEPGKGATFSFTLGGTPS